MPLRVLVTGGGVAALETVVGLHHLAPGRVEALLVAPERDFVYRPLATGDPFALGKVRRYPLADLVRRVDAEHVQAAMERVDPGRRTVRTTDGRTFTYDVLVVALGALAVPALPHAFTFAGPQETEAMHGLVQDLEGGYVRRVAFVVPDGITWPLPAYELALQTAERAYGTGVAAEVTIVTPEAAPLEVFGAEGSAAVAGMLEEAGVRVITGTVADVPARGTVRLPDGSVLTADRVVALPRLEGPRVPGLPADRDGFIPVDEHARVTGVQDVFAAGDVTAFPVKQGGVATQMADAALEVIAARAGEALEPAPFRPVLRGMLLTGRRPRYLRYDQQAGEAAVTAERALWWPPGKIAGRYLTPFLGDADGEPPRDGVPLEVALETDPSVPRRRAVILPRPPDDAARS